jgi:hypothetical protein
MLGDVPISVIRPPSSEPNDIGISSFDTGVPVLRSSWKATGMNVASAPMFFTRAETSVTEETSTTTWRLMVVRNGRTPRNRTSTTPDRATAALTTSAEATITTTSSAKPENARSAGTMPTATDASSASRATRS